MTLIYLNNHHTLREMAESGLFLPDRVCLGVLITKQIDQETPIRGINSALVFENFFLNET